MICDKLVIGIQDASLLQQFQLDAELTLEKAKKFVHHHKKEEVCPVCPHCSSRTMDTISATQGLGLDSAFLDAIEDAQATMWTVSSCASLTCSLTQQGIQPDPEKLLLPAPTN